MSNASARLGQGAQFGALARHRATMSHLSSVNVASSRRIFD